MDIHGPDRFYIVFKLGHVSQGLYVYMFTTSNFHCVRILVKVVTITTFHAACIHAVPLSLSRLLEDTRFSKFRFSLKSGAHNEKERKRGRSMKRPRSRLKLFSTVVELLNLDVRTCLHTVPRHTTALRTRSMGSSRLDCKE